MIPNGVEGGTFRRDRPDRLLAVTELAVWQRAGTTVPFEDKTDVTAIRGFDSSVRAPLTRVITVGCLL